MLKWCCSGLDDFTVDKYEEGSVYTRLHDTNLTLLIRLKSPIPHSEVDAVRSRRQVDTEPSLRNYSEFTFNIYYAIIVGLFFILIRLI